MKIINQGFAKGYVYNFKKKAINLTNNIKDVKKEEDIFLEAIENSKKRLKLLAAKTTNNIKDVVETYLVLLNDEVVKGETIKRIYDFHESAGLAYTKVVNKYIDLLNKSEDAYLQERIADFLEIKEKVIMEINQGEEVINLTRPTILIVERLTVALVLNLPKEVKGIIALDGGVLSHAAILIKEKNIPCLISDKLKFADGEFITLNANKEKLAVNSSFVGKEKATLQESFKRVKEKEINLYLNLSTLESLEDNQKKYYQGVGLLRSEYLFSLDYPKLDVQIKYYQKILKNFNDKEVAIRLFDFKKDKQGYLFINEDVNEFKFSGALSAIYQDQLKALVMANESYGNLKIIIPMIRRVNEYYAVKEYLQFLKKELRLTKAIPKLGIMLETKEALINIKEYQEVDFVNIGTNDLTKELYNIKREEALDVNVYQEKLLVDLEVAVNFFQTNQIFYLFCGDFVSTKSGFTKLLNKGEKNYSIASSFLTEAIEIINNLDK